MQEIGHLRKTESRYEFHYSELNLVIRGPYAEWVLEAAAEIIQSTHKLQTEGEIEGLKTLIEFDEAEAIALDAAEYVAQERFETVPQCTVSMGDMDYKWMSAVGRGLEGSDFDGQYIKRLHNMAMTRNDTFLKNVDGVELKKD